MKNSFQFEVSSATKGKTMNELTPEDIKRAYLTGAFAEADDWTVVGKYVTEFAHAIIAAHEAQRQAGQEPVLCQYRTCPAWEGDKRYWQAWTECCSEAADNYERITPYNNWHYEVRRLYTAPQPAPVQAALAYHAALNETLNDTNVQLRDDVAGYQAALAEKNAEIAALRQAVIVQPMPENMAKSIFDGIATDPKVGQFDAFNWFTAGVASAEQWQKVYLDAAIAQAVQPT